MIMNHMNLDNPENGLEIEVVAEAIQADNIGSYAEAWGDVDAPDSQIDIDATKSSNEVGTTVTAAE